jgi:hypothetical protein
MLRRSGEGPSDLPSYFRPCPCGLAHRGFADGSPGYADCWRLDTCLVGGAWADAGVADRAEDQRGGGHSASAVVATQHVGEPDPPIFGRGVGLGEWERHPTGYRGDVHVTAAALQPQLARIPIQRRGRPQFPRERQGQPLRRARAPPASERARMRPGGGSAHKRSHAASIDAATVPRRNRLIGSPSGYLLGVPLPTGAYNRDDDEGHRTDQQHPADDPHDDRVPREVRNGGTDI